MQKSMVRGYKWRSKRQSIKDCISEYYLAYCFIILLVYSPPLMSENRTAYILLDHALKSIFLELSSSIYVFIKLSPLVE